MLMKIQEVISVIMYSSWQKLNILWVRKHLFLIANLFFLLYDLVIPMKKRSLIGSLSSMNFAIKLIQAAKMDKLLLQSIAEN